MIAIRQRETGEFHNQDRVTKQSGEGISRAFKLSAVSGFSSADVCRVKLRAVSSHQ